MLEVGLQRLMEKDKGEDNGGMIIEEVSIGIFYTYIQLK